MLATLALGTAFGAAPAIAVDASGEVVATVEGRPIPASLYRMFLKNGLEALALEADTAEGQRRIALLREGIVAELIDRALIEGEGRRRGLAVSEEALARRLAQMKSGMGGEAGYRAYLGEHGLSEEELRATLVQELYGALLQDELSKDLRVGDGEVRAFYEKEKANPALAALFRESEQAEAAHILIAARQTTLERRLRERDGLSGEALARAVRHAMEAARNKAEDLRRQALSGADFVELARHHSDDPGSRAQGGDLGRFPRNRHTAAFDAAVFAARPGRIGPVVQTEYGFHVIQVRRHTPERLRTLEETRTAIHGRLLAHKKAAHLAAWLDQRRQAATISVISAFGASGPPSGRRKP